MNSLICLTVFMLFSFRSVFDDARSFRVRTGDLALGIMMALAIKALLGMEDWAGTLAGGAVGALAFFAIMKFSKGRLGAGDLWYSTFIGFAFGFWAWDIGILVAAFLGVLWTGMQRVSGPRRIIRDIRIPFVPFMFVGAVSVAIVGGIAQ